MGKFVHCESFKHKTAKELLATWLRKLDESEDFCSFGDVSWRSNYGVHLELPFYEHDEPYYFESSPGLISNSDNPFRKHYNHQEAFDPQQIHLRGRLLFVPDIAIFHKGSPSHLIEVVHKSYPSEKKIQEIQTFFDTKGAGINLLTISADHILGQVQEPKSLSFEKILDITHGRVD